MSKEKQNKDLGTSLSVKEVFEFLPVIFQTDLRPVLMGHTGIGKTEIVRQYAMQRNMDLVILYTSQIEPADFIGLYKTTEEGRTSNCPPDWLPFREIKMDKANGKGLKEVMPKAGDINPNGGIIFLDEFNRGKEDIRQAMYQFLSQKKIHTYSLPENYHIVCAANPGNSGNYEVYESDEALVNRLAWVKLRPSFEETQEYLEKKHGKSLVIDWLKTDKATIQYGDEFDIEGRTYSPRIEEAHIILYNLIKDKTTATKMKFLNTCLQPELTQSFMSFEEEMSHINYKDILTGKAKKQTEELVTNARMDVLSTLISHLGEYWVEKAKQVGDEKEIKNTTDFLVLVPEELVTFFLDTLKNSYNEKTSIQNNEYFKTKIKPRLKGLKEVI